MPPTVSALTPPPVQTALIGQAGLLSLPWARWFHSIETLANNIGAGAAYLAATQTFTSLNTFTQDVRIQGVLIMGSTPITITNAAGYVLTSAIAGGQALTRTNDTNVTATLGGTPATALLAATSITLGWTGQLSIARGGTGQATAAAAFDALAPTTTQGDLIYRNATTNTRLAAGTATQVLHGGLAPTWSAVSLTADVSGVLPVANGGTNLSSYAVGDLLYASGATTLSRLADVAVGAVLVSGGVTTAAAWDASPFITGPVAIGIDETAMVIGGVTYTSLLAVTSNTQAITEIHTYAAGVSSVAYFARARGTQTVPVVVQQNDILGVLSAVGYDGTDFETGGALLFQVDDTPGNNDMPTSFAVYLAPNGSATVQQRLLLSSNGNVAFGTVTTGVWNGTTVAIAHGGTNATSQTNSGVAYFDSSKITTGAGWTFDGTNSVLANAAYYQGKDTGGTARNLIGHQAFAVINLGYSGSTMSINNGVMTVGSAGTITVPNNIYFDGTTTAAAVKRLIGLSASDKVSIDPDALGAVFGASLTLASPLVVGSGGTGTATAFTAGSVVFAGASGVYSQDNANIFWDDTNNRLSIGSNSPFRQLTLSQAGGAEINMIDATSGQSWLWQQNGAPLRLYDLTNGKEVINFTQSTGMVRMAQYGAGAATFDASGNITSVSDERLKRGIRPWTRGLDFVRQLETIDYQYGASSGLETAHRYVGFGARQVRTIAPELVFKNAVGHLSLWERGITAGLVNAVKELADRVEALEGA